MAQGREEDIGNDDTVEGACPLQDTKVDNGEFGNTALGAYTLYSDTNGNENTATRCPCAGQQHDRQR